MLREHLGYVVGVGVLEHLRPEADLLKEQPQAILMPAQRYKVKRGNCGRAAQKKPFVHVRALYEKEYEGSRIYFSRSSKDGTLDGSDPNTLVVSRDRSAELSGDSKTR